jgi:hypothetical protein
MTQAYKFNPFKTKININYTDTVRTPQSTLSVSVIQTSQLMLYREIIAVCFQFHTKHTNTVWANRGTFGC